MLYKRMIAENIRAGRRAEADKLTNETDVKPQGVNELPNESLEAPQTLGRRVIEGSQKIDVPFPPETGITD